MLEIDLTADLPELQDLEGYVEAMVLVRWHGYPLGTVRLPVTLGRVAAAELRTRILAELRAAWSTRLLADALAADGLLTPERLLAATPSPADGKLPSVTVAVCSRDRPEDLQRCLEGIAALDLACEVLVVDNAPSSEATRRLVLERFPSVRYVREDRPGLDWARSRAALEATGEVIAYTDDDVVVDPGWARAVAGAFADDPQVMAVTGLVLPLELETEAQELFERYGGFSRGFRRRWYRADLSSASPKVGSLVASGNFGTGANMAYRRSVFADVGLFDPALDVGTLTGGAGDHEMFFRVLKGGWTLAYEPQALVWHRHRRTIPELRRQIAANASVFAYFEAAARRHPDERLAFARVTAAWLKGFHLKELARALSQPTGLPADLLLAELRGQLSLVAGRRYARAVRQAAAIRARCGPQPGALPEPPAARPWEPPPAQRSEAVVRVSLEGPVDGVPGLAGHNGVRAVLTAAQLPVGTVAVACHGAPVSGRRLREAVAEELGLAVVEPTERGAAGRAEVVERVTHGLGELVRVPSGGPRRLELPDDVPVSIVVSTFDRPQDLRRCLTSLQDLRTGRPVEVLVVDNHPGSGLTAPLAAEFPGVRFLSEPRQGVAFGRNRGIVESTGDIVATIDDDAVADPDWLERLLSPFARADVAAATGNILPADLSRPPQQRFEDYSGLGRGYRRMEVGPEWFGATAKHAVPTWELGGTCNAAFRRSVFSDPQVGLMDEALGPGMPSGVGEDSYLLYRVLKRGHTVVYEPEAVVWHHHRSTPDALERQLFGYYKGGVSHQLATLHHDHDLRAVPALLWDLPRWHAGQLRLALSRRRGLPLSVWTARAKGTLAGPWAYRRSLQQAARLGRTPLPGHTADTAVDAGSE